MEVSVAELCALLRGEAVGDTAVKLNTVAKIEEGVPGALSFLANPKYEEHIYTTRSSAVLVRKDFVPTAAVNATLIKVDDPYSAFTFLLEKFANPMARRTGIEPMSFVHQSASLGADVYLAAFSYVDAGAQIGAGSRIMPQVYIGQNVKIGENCLIYSGVHIYHDCVIGNNCIIHSGTVIGSDGFGFAPQADRSYKKIPQTGNVIIEDDVEIGSNSSIDRATMGSTIIRKGAKLDNLIQIAHNVEVGEHTVMAGQSGIAGSTKLGKYIVVGGQVAFAGHLKIADGNQFGGQTGVGGHIREENAQWLGTPFMKVKDSLKTQVVYRRLPEMLARIESLEKELKQLKGE